MSQIFESIAAIMNEVPAIGKNKQNQQQNFKYRGIDDAYNALQPLMAKHGIFTVPEVVERTREERINAKGTALAFVTLRVKYTFYAKDGSSLSCIVEGEGMDSGDKATSKALAISHKYALMQVFCVPTEDMPDPDAESHEIKGGNKAVTAKAKAVNPDPMTKPQSDALMAYLTKRHGQDRAAYLVELSEFFRRDIKSSRELTKTDVSEFLNALTFAGNDVHPQQ